VVVAVLVALTVPLAISLRDRARAEKKTEVLTSALTIASGFDSETLRAGPALDRKIQRYADQVGGRVIALDRRGVVLADSDGKAVGDNFLTPLRPELHDHALFAAAPSADAEIRFSTKLQTDLMVAAAPVVDPGLVGAVRISMPIQAVNDAVRRTTIGLVSVVGGVGLIIGLVIAFVVSGSLARPLTRLAAVAHRLGSGDLSARANDVSGADEIEELAGSFDDMADRVERTVQAQREFVANASHQLRTPLTGMKLRLESAIERSDSAEMTHDLTAADKEIDRLAATVDRLLVMARTLEEGGSTEIELHAAAVRAVERWQERASTRSSTLSVEGEPVMAQANATDIDQILDNLLENAMTYAPGAIELQTGTAERRAFVAVRDHGAGITLEEQTKVTERFYRGKTAPPGGSGLGLAIAGDLAERWGGALSVQSAEGGGIRVEVRFRVASAPANATDDQADA
jgi:two-component system, OmpR family, sensor kinase